MVPLSLSLSLSHVKPNSILYNSTGRSISQTKNQSSPISDFTTQTQPWKNIKNIKKQIIIYTQLDDLTIYHKFMIPGCNSKKLKHIKKNKN